MSLASGDRVVWLLPDDTAARWTLTLEPGWVSPGYGVKVPTTVLVWKAHAALPIDASFLFAESRLTPAERVRAIAVLGVEFP